MNIALRNFFAGILVMGWIWWIVEAVGQYGTTQPAYQVDVWLITSTAFFLGFALYGIYILITRVDDY